MAKESSLKALMAMKCPKCHEGEMFTHPNLYSLKLIHKMPDVCPACGQSFQPEPGFYTGAMYVNYGFTVVLTAFTYLILEIILKVPTPVFFAIYLGILLLISPLLFRYSRVIYLYLFVKYDNEAIKKHKLLH